MTPPANLGTHRDACGAAHATNVGVYVEWDCAPGDDFGSDPRPGMPLAILSCAYCRQPIDRTIPVRGDLEDALREVRERGVVLQSIARRVEGARAIAAVTA